MPNQNYPVEFEATEDGQVIARCPDLPEVFAVGDNEEQALADAAGAVEAALQGRIRDREEIPQPSAAKGRQTVGLALLAEIKAELHNEMLRNDVSHAKLARLLGKADQKDIRRLLDLKHASRIGQLERAFAAVGAEIAFKIRRPKPAKGRTQAA